MKKGLQLGEVYNLEDLALATGASLEFGDGRKFNTSNAEIKRKRQEPKPTVEQPPPQPVQQDATADMLRQIIAVLNRPVEVKLPDMPTPQVVVESPRTSTPAPTNWSFEFERNPNGTIKRINASSYNKGIN